MEGLIVNWWGTEQGSEHDLGVEGHILDEEGQRGRETSQSGDAITLKTFLWGEEHIF